MESLQMLWGDRKAGPVIQQVLTALKKFGSPNLNSIHPLSHHDCVYRFDHTYPLLPPQTQYSERKSSEGKNRDRIEAVHGMRSGNRNSIAPGTLLAWEFEVTLWDPT
jgi:hypothetical protein